MTRKEEKAATEHGKLLSRGCKYDDCTNPECNSGRMVVVGRQIDCPVCKGEGFLDTRFSDLLGDPEVRARLDGVLGLPVERRG